MAPHRSARRTTHPTIGTPHHWVSARRYRCGAGNGFSAAASGGAYNSGHRAAQGRLEAWQSLAGLAGAPTGATIQEASLAATGCDWMEIRSASRWFEHVAWDIALLCLRPGGREIALLCATDTD